MLGIAEWPIWLLALVFAGAAAVVWAAGSRLAGYVDEISDRTGMGKGFAGLVLLGGITSLPEVAVSVTSSLTGGEVLAANNVLGSVASQVALLALADAVIGREALTSVVVKPVILLQGALNVILLALVAAAITAGDVAPLGFAGLWSFALLAGYLASVWTLASYEQRMPWMVRPGPDDDQGGPKSEGAEDAGQGPGSEGHSLRGLVLRTVAAAIAILIAGYLLSETGSAVAKRSGVGQAFFGATAVAIATSLPEISTMVAAVRIRRYEMAIGDIFGTNLFNAALLFLIDLLSPGPPLLSRIGAFSAFGALLGLVLTAFFLAGAIERRNRTVLRMGWDSLAAIVIYAAGVVMLWMLRGETGSG